MADKPVTREEKYLAYLTGDYKGELPKPITRKEKYLYELCLRGIGGEISPEEIKNAVNEYLEKNPVKPGATTEQAQQIEQNRTDVASLKKETGSLKEDISNIFSNNIFDVSKCIKGKAYATTYNVSTLEDFVDNEKAYSVPAIALPYNGKITVNQKFNWSLFIAFYIRTIFTKATLPLYRTIMGHGHLRIIWMVVIKSHSLYYRTQQISIFQNSW